MKLVHTYKRKGRTRRLTTASSVFFFRLSTSMSPPKRLSWRIRIHSTTIPSFFRSISKEFSLTHAASNDLVFSVAKLLQNAISTFTACGNQALRGRCDSFIKAKGKIKERNAGIECGKSSADVLNPKGLEISTDGFWHLHRPSREGLTLPSVYDGSNRKTLS